MIVIMGAAGNTGSKIATALIGRDHAVRALGRAADRLAALVRRGAEPCIGDASDRRHLDAAFSGADAAYVLLSVDPTAADYLAAAAEQGECIVDALERSGVQRVVALSSLGADSSGEVGLIRALRDQEARLARLADREVTLLRPGSFFENFRQSLPLIAEQGILADAVVADLPLPMVATRDIAAAAVGALAGPGRGRGTVIHELLGPEDISHAHVARVLGGAIGRPDLAYVQMPYEALESALVATGLGGSFASLYAAMTRAFNEGRVGPMAGRTPANTTQTSFDAFVPELAASFGSWNVQA